MYKRSIYRDKLGTNIGKVEKREFCGQVSSGGQYKTESECKAKCHGAPAPPPAPGQQCNPHAKPPQNCKTRT
jgi:hypothetical protein